MSEYTIDREQRINEVVEFFGYPRELTECLFKHSKAYFEGSWNAITDKYSFCYYANGFYAIRQMSYTQENVFSPSKKSFLDKVNGRFLDIACGVGDYAIYLAQKGVKCFVTEHIGVPINFLKYRFKKHGVDVGLIIGNIYPEVDYSMACSSLDHLDDPITTAKELCRITKNKIFATPCIDETYNRPTHKPHILKQVPKAFEIINEHNSRA